jgi:hypothetical protein
MVFLPRVDKLSKIFGCSPRRTTAPIISVFAAAFIALCTIQTRADTIALSFTGRLAAPATETITAGWAFSVSTPIELTQLGYGIGLIMDCKRLTL